MKRFISLALTLIFTAGLLSSCTSKTATAKATEYMGLKPDTLYVYTGEGSEYAGYSVFNDYIRENEGLYQRRLLLSNNQYLGEIFNYKNGMFTNYYAEPTLTYFWDMTKTTPNNTLTILKEPLQVDTSWVRGSFKRDVDADVSITMNAKITSMNASVTVPYGTFEAMEVTISYSDNSQTTKEYYVKDLGLVKTDVVSDSISYSSNLSEVKPGSSMDMQFAYFYPTSATTIDYETRDCKFETNCDSAAVILSGFNSYTEYEKGSLIPDGTKINSVSYSSSGKRLKIDFSKEFMPIGISKEDEYAILQCVVNTLGYMFNATSVAITIDGGAYKSENIELETTLYIPVAGAPEESSNE